MKFVFVNIVWIFCAAAIAASSPVELKASQALVQPQPVAQVQADTPIVLLQSSAQPTAIRTFVQPQNGPNFVTWSG